jgi:hypothetical protein
MPGMGRLPRRLRERVAMIAGFRCGYCRTRESKMAYSHSILNESDIEAEIRLCVPAGAFLKQDLASVIVFEVEFG